jgi:hypothetical protein
MQPQTLHQVAPRTENRCHLDYLGATEERNARVFNDKATVPLAVMQRIEEKSKNMIMAGAKHLAKLMT